MKVFIEKSANIPYVKSGTVTWIYPYPYGYIIDTKSADDAELDCFVITDKILQENSVVECHPIGLMEQFEDDLEDHNILAVLEWEEAELTEEIKQKLVKFITNTPDYRPVSRVIKVGKFYGKKEAEELIRRSLI